MKKTKQTQKKVKTFLRKKKKTANNQLRSGGSSKVDILETKVNILEKNVIDYASSADPRPILVSRNNQGEVIIR